MSSNAVAHARNLLGPLVRLAYRVRITGAHHVPRRGGLLIVANHPGLIDPVILEANSPRPVHVVTDGGVLPEVWERTAPLTGRLIARDPVGPVLRQAVDLLRANRAVAMFPEGGLTDGSVDDALPGVGFVAARADVPVVPVALFGTHGQRPTDPPTPRSEIDLIFGEPFTLPRPTDPARRAEALRLTEAIRQRLADHVRHARDRTGRTAPAPTGENGPS